MPQLPFHKDYLLCRLNFNFSKVYPSDNMSAAPSAPIDVFAKLPFIGEWGDDDDLIDGVIAQSAHVESEPVTTPQATTSTTQATTHSRRESAAQIRAEKARRAAEEAAAKIADAETRHVLRQERNAENVAFIAAAKRGELNSKQCKAWRKRLPGGEMPGVAGEHWVDTTFAKMYGGAFAALSIDLMGRQAPLAVCVDGQWAPFWTQAYWNAIQPPVAVAAAQGPSYNAPTKFQPMPAPRPAQGAARLDEVTPVDTVQVSCDAERIAKRDADRAAIQANIDSFISVAIAEARKLRANPQVDPSRGRCEPATCQFCVIAMGVKYAALQHRYRELSFLLATFCVKPTVAGAPELFSHIVAKHVNYIPDMVESFFKMCGLEYAESIEMSHDQVRFNLSQCKTIEDFVATCPTRTCADGPAIATNNDVSTIRELTMSYKTIIALFAKEASARARAQPVPAVQPAVQPTTSAQSTAQVTEPAVPQTQKTGKAWCAVPKVATYSVVEKSAETAHVETAASAQVETADSFAKAAEVALHDTQLQQELVALKKQLAAQEASYLVGIERMQSQLQAQLAAQMEEFASMLGFSRPA